MLIGNAEAFTIAGVGDRARSCEVQLKERILIDSNVSGDNIASARFLNEDQGIPSRTTHWHFCSSRVEEPFLAIQGTEIIF